MTDGAPDGATEARRKAALASVRECRRRFKETTWAKGLKRITVWVAVEDVEAEAGEEGRK